MREMREMRERRERRERRASEEITGLDGTNMWRRNLSRSRMRPKIEGQGGREKRSGRVEDRTRKVDKKGQEHGKAGDQKVENVRKR
eukprot:3272543-Rhodomonas_salina.1